MKKILVPFDFSSASSWGYYYAYDLAATLGAELLVMHMYLPHSDTSVFEDFKTFSKEQAVDRKEELLKHLKIATQKPLNKQVPDVPVTYLLDYGERNEIAHYVKLHGADLVVMGTNGGTTSNKVFGSNTVTVMENTDCPVLAIPLGAEFKPSMNMAYATDLTEESIDTLVELADLAALIKANLYCVYVNEIKGGAYSEAEAPVLLKMKEHQFNIPVHFTTWSAVTIEDGLETFCRVNDIDVLVVMKHKRTTWQKLLGQRSITNNMALRTDIPIFALQE
jgi:nucleotide-binding universal stress UspA family protein